jgi:DNA-binding NarL/FixJ family response regulator
MTSRRPRLILADDHHLMVEGLRLMLEGTFHIAAVAHDGDTLLAVLAESPADCLLLDLALPGRTGLDLLPEIKKLRRDLKILVVTMHLDRVLADAALQAGAHGFIPKDSGKEELVEAIRTVLAGRRYLSPRVPRMSHRVSLSAMHTAAARLTPRQQDIVRLIGQGKSTSEIARILGVGQVTVTYHRTSARKALGIDSEWGLVRYAILLQVAEAEAAAPKGEPQRP